MTSTALGPGAEFDTIRELVERWGPRAVDIGDDAAILRVPRGDELVVSVDSAVEGQHFRAGWLTPHEVGYRAVAAALSDLAAMAAHPIGVLVAIVVPTAWRTRLGELADGIGEAVDVAPTNIRGGNLSAGEEMSITTTVLGHAFAPLARSGARPGDFVYVTGRLGGAGTGLAQLLAGDRAGTFRARYARPIPRLAEARWLADHGASSAIDVSDGLVGDLQHLAAASAVGVELVAEQVPRPPDVDIELALRSGEEYELIVTTPREFDRAEFERRFMLPLTRVGAIVSAAPGSVRVSGVLAAGHSGFDHFAR